jgi:hypothetical protein
MRAALDSRSIRRRVRIEGPRWAARFSAVTIARTMAGIYADLADVNGESVTARP